MSNIVLFEFIYFFAVKSKLLSLFCESVPNLTNDNGKVTLISFYIAFLKIHNSKFGRFGYTESYIFIFSDLINCRSIS